VLQNQSVSKSQAVIESDGARFLLRNLSQVNITYVNDLPVAETDLHPGDLIEMGLVKLRFFLGQSQ
jgi:pSer/pThr/pTyr-binding forkhead associated (FHA) protein